MNINQRIFSISLVAALGMVLMLVIGWRSFSIIESSLQEVLVGSADHVAGSGAETQADFAGTDIESLLGVASFARKEFAVLTVVGLGALVGLSFWLGRSISGRIHKIAGQVTEIAEQRDLVARLDDTSRDEIGMFAKSFNTFSEQIYQTVSSAGQTAQEVAGAATELSATSEEMTMTMGHQSSQIEQIVASVMQMGESVTDVAQKASGASQNAEQAGEVATSGGEVVRDTIIRMQAIDEAVSASAVAVRELGKRGEKIGEVILVINDIAEQTNLLALNAAIEAARAGEHGRGFAVVADEVRKLADRTTNATEEIAESIKAIQTETAQAVDRMNTGTEQVRDGVSRAKEAGEALGQIVGNTNEVATMVEAIAGATEEQTASSAEINMAVDSVQASTRESMEAAEQSSQAVHQLSRQAEQLQQMISQFRLDAA